MDLLKKKLAFPLLFILIFALKLTCILSIQIKIELKIFKLLLISTLNEVSVFIIVFSIFSFFKKKTFRFFALFTASLILIFNHLYYLTSQEFISSTLIENMNWISIKGSIGDASNYMFAIVILLFIFLTAISVSFFINKMKVKLKSFNFALILLCMFISADTYRYSGRYGTKLNQEGALKLLIPSSYLQSYNELKKEYFSPKKQKKITFSKSQRELLQKNFIGKAHNTNLKMPSPKRIVVILMESYPNIYLNEYNQNIPKEVSPYLNSLIEQGKLFTNYYTSGIPTDNGVSATLCSFPIFNIKNQYKGINCLPELLSKYQYKTSLYRGVSLLYRNHIKSYKKAFKFDQLFGPEQLNLKPDWSWGAEDEKVFEFAAKEFVTGEEQKKFILINTMDTHPPYHSKSSKFGSKVLNSLALNDKNISTFISKLEKNKLWDDTLLILSSDHSPNHGDYLKITNKTNYRPTKIPLFFLGNSYLSKELNKLDKDLLISQLDILPTIEHAIMSDEDTSHLGSSMFLVNESRKFILTRFDRSFKALPSVRSEELNSLLKLILKWDRY